MSDIMIGNDENVLWSENKRFMTLKNPFTKYTLTNRAIYVEHGIIRYAQEEIRLFRVRDVSLTKTIGERMFGTGTVTVLSSDASTPAMHIGPVKNAARLKMLLNERIDAERKRQGVRAGEFIR